MLRFPTAVGPLKNCTLICETLVVSDPLREGSPWDGRPAADWDANLSFRTSLWDQGFGPAKAMDNMQKRLGRQASDLF